MSALPLEGLLTSPEDVQRATAALWSAATKLHGNVVPPEVVSKAESDVVVVRRVVDECLPRSVERDVYVAAAPTNVAGLPVGVMVYVDVDPKFVDDCEGALRRWREDATVQWNRTETRVREISREPMLAHGEEESWS